MNNYRIKDESNDHKYFTIVPNYILNHSKAVDQALYLQMKRFASDKGACYASERTLMKQLGVGTRVLKQSLNYLIEHNWIKLQGFKEVNTPGGVQKVRVYVINDLWKLNVEYYEGASKQTHLRGKGASEMMSRCFQTESKVLSNDNQRRLIEEEHKKIGFKNPKDEDAFSQLRRKVQELGIKKAI